MLLDLSVELLELIGVQLTHSELAISRTVCKALNGALCRSFFSLLVLKTNGNGLSRDRVALLKALATRETGWSVHAKTLRVVPTKQLALRSVNVNDDTLIPLLAAALAALPKIHIVVWHVADQNSWVWERTAVLAFLTSLDDTLHELELNIPSTINLSALQIRGLRKLTFKQGPGLWSLGGLGVSNGLGLLGPTPKLPLIYDDIAALISQNHRLTSLHLEGTSEWSAIWRMLQSRKRGARLTEITTNIVTNDLFSYLSSYSGLKKLTLILPDGGNPATSNHLAEAFFETVLPLHAESLTELSCPAAYESGFSFGTHNVHVISSLHKLTRLEMSINAGEVRRVDFYNSHSQTMFPFVATFDGWLSSEGEQDDVDLVVTLLLETAAAFPSLQSLLIRAAETEKNRGSGKRARIKHTNAANVAIGNTVEAFRTDVPCAATLYAGYAIFELVRPPPFGGRPELMRYVQTGWWSPYPL